MIGEVAAGRLFDLVIAAIEAAHRDPYRRRERFTALRGRALVRMRTASSARRRREWEVRLAGLDGRLAALDLEINAIESLA